MAKTKADSATPSPKKVFDVTRPGKTPAPPSGKPVIVGHRPVVKDSSVNGITERAPLATHKKIEVTTGTRMPPIEVPNEPGPTITHDNIPEKEVEAIATVALDSTTETDLTPAFIEDKTAKVEPGVERKPVTPLPDDDLLETTIVPEAPTEGIVVSNHASKSGSVGRTIILIIIVLVLALVILDVLLDAGFIKLDVFPQTDLL
jgi:hypothetical protein